MADNRGVTIQLTEKQQKAVRRVTGQEHTEIRLEKTEKLEQLRALEAKLLPSQRTRLPSGASANQFPDRSLNHFSPNPSEFTK